MTGHCMMTTREFLSKNRILFDGAFGTYFAQITHGQTENCELANLNLPQTVARIHREYIEAGANAIKTNTFAAYPDLCGGAENQKKIIRAAVALAREEADKADGEVRVFADLGPAPGESRQQKTDSYIQAASLFLDEGITDFVFETQAEEDGLLPAVREIRKREKESFIVVSFGVLPDGYSPKGIYYRTLILDMLSSGLVDAAGLNCVVNAGNMRRLLAALPSGLLARTCAMPNAGYPVVRGFHTYYGGNAPYFARETGEIADLGVRILGGCCGTTPQYIRALSKVLSERPAEEIDADTLWTLPESTDVQKNKSGAQAVSSNRLKKKLSAGKKVIAVELDSPKNADLSTFMEEAGRLKKAGVDTITIADCPIAQARLDASLLACKVKQELDLDVIPHMTCRDRNINASKALLLGDHANGIRNVLIITGDPIPTAARDEVKSVYQFNSRQMIGYVHSLNESDFQVMSKAVYTGNKNCWSEMFFDTYSLVSAYCAGCGNHPGIISEERNRFALVKKITSPVKMITGEVAKLFAGANEAVLLTDLNNYDLITSIIEMGFQTLVFDDSSSEIYMDLLLNLHTYSNINFMGMKEYMQLLEESDYYYVSGATIVIYKEENENVYRKMARLRRLSLNGNIKLLHVFEKNLYFSETGKDIKSIIDGPVLEQYDVERI